MRVKFSVVSLLCFAVLLFGCEPKYLIGELSYDIYANTLMFDKDEIVIDVTPDSGPIEVTFHANDSILGPDDYLYLWVDIIGKGKTTARNKKHYTIDSLNVWTGRIPLHYNLSDSTGSFVINLIPENITEPLVIHFEKYYHYYGFEPNESLIVRLNPVELLP